MHILMLTNAIAPDKLGGLERYVRELSAELVRQGHVVTTLSKKTSPDQAETERGEDGVHLLRYPAPSKSDPLFALKYPRVISQGVARGLATFAAQGVASDDVVVHGHFPVPMLPLLRRNARFVYTFHAPVHQELLGERQGSYELPRAAQGLAVGGLRVLERRVLRKASAVTTLSQFIADEMTELVGAAHAPAIRIPGGLDTHRFSPLGGVARPVAVTGGPLIVTARRLVERTGVEQLVRAMPQVRRLIPDAQLVVLGEGPRRPDIETYVRSAGLEDCIHLLGRVSEDDLVAWYRSADLAVTPTRELEGFGLSTAEALACGTPALVTPVGANPEVVSGLGAAFVAAGNRPDDLAVSIVEVLSSTSMLEAARERARDLVHPAMSWEAVAARFVDVYRQALRGDVRAP